MRERSRELKAAARLEKDKAAGESDVLAKIAEMMAKGTFASINLATPDLDATFERVQANGEVVQEPTEQPYGVRDCSVRDPAGNLLRIQELR